MGTQGGWAQFSHLESRVNSKTSSTHIVGSELTSGYQFLALCGRVTAVPFSRGGSGGLQKGHALVHLSPGFLSSRTPDVWARSFCCRALVSTVGRSAASLPTHQMPVAPPFLGPDEQNVPDTATCPWRATLPPAGNCCFSPSRICTGGIKPKGTQAKGVCTHVIYTCTTTQVPEH